MKSAFGIKTRRGITNVPLEEATKADVQDASTFRTFCSPQEVAEAVATCEAVKAQLSFEGEVQQKAMPESGDVLVYVSRTSGGLTPQATRERLHALLG